MLSLFKCLRVSEFLKLLCNFKNAALLTLMRSTDVKDRKLYSLCLFNVVDIITLFSIFRWAYQYFKHIRIP